MTTNTPHPHADILRAIADGVPIQLWHIYYQEQPAWVDIYPDYYFENCTDLNVDRLRIKPKKVYPVTSYTAEELQNIYFDINDSSLEAFVRIANAVLKRYTDEQEAQGGS